mgnify:CR=1 FL=1
MPMRIRVIAVMCSVGGLTFASTAVTSVASVPGTTKPPPRVVLAPSRSNQTVHLHVGDRLKVRLGTSYRRPKSSRPKVLERLGYSGGYPSSVDARATFKALRTGRADVSSVTDYPCLHTTPRCAIAQQIWTVHVVVR